ncbi:probable fatty acid-binding protein [Eurosta solidaginis]|uniref:probable fatty acid-binding protein n=1 Tax=Eurosta solidaginis TaxID=178769 RepID=UPI003530B67E
MAVWEGKIYKLETSENFDEFMKELGVDVFMRNMANSLKPTVELRRDGDTYTFTTISTFKTSVITFQLGKEFDEETLDGRKVKSIMTLDGNKLIEEQKGEKHVTIVREFSDSQLVTTITLNNIRCVRVYKAI